VEDDIDTTIINPPTVRVLSQDLAIKYIDNGYVADDDINS